MCAVQIHFSCVSHDPYKLTGRLSKVVVENIGSDGSVMRMVKNFMLTPHFALHKVTQHGILYKTGFDTSHALDLVYEEWQIGAESIPG